MLFKVHIDRIDSAMNAELLVQRHLRLSFPYLRFAFNQNIPPLNEITTATQVLCNPTLINSPRDKSYPSARNENKYIQTAWITFFSHVSGACKNLPEFAARAQSCSNRAHHIATYFVKLRSRAKRGSRSAIRTSRTTRCPFGVMLPSVENGDSAMFAAISCLRTEDYARHVCSIAAPVNGVCPNQGMIARLGPICQLQFCKWSHTGAYCDQFLFLGNLQRK